MASNFGRGLAPRLVPQRQGPSRGHAVRGRLWMPISRGGDNRRRAWPVVEPRNTTDPRLRRLWEDHRGTADPRDGPFTSRL